MNDRQRAAFLADLQVLVQLVDHPDTEYKIPAVHAAELRYGDWAALGFPAGGGNGGRSSGVSDPTCTAVVPPSDSPRHVLRSDAFTAQRAEFDRHWKMAAFHVKALARLVAQGRPVPPVPDPPLYPCQNNDCPTVCRGIGDDRLVKPHGQDKSLCPRCRMHWTRHGKHWPKRSDGSDVREQLKPLACDGAA